MLYPHYAPGFGETGVHLTDELEYQILQTVLKVSGVFSTCSHRYYWLCKLQPGLKVQQICCFNGTVYYIL